jgi:hypothetical protein
MGPVLRLAARPAPWSGVEVEKTMNLEMAMLNPLKYHHL